MHGSCSSCCCSAGFPLLSREEKGREKRATFIPSSLLSLLSSFEFLVYIHTYRQHRRLRCDVPARISLTHFSSVFSSFSLSLLRPCSVYLFLYLSISVSIYLSISESVYLSTSVSIYLFLYLSIDLGEVSVCVQRFEGMRNAWK